MCHIITSIITILILIIFPASLVSKCALNGTVANFHCENAYTWRINYIIPQENLGTKENASFLVNTNDHVFKNGSVSLVTCIVRQGGYEEYRSAALTITGKSIKQLTKFYISTSNKILNFHIYLIKNVY